MAQVALAWVLARPGVTAPIVGTTQLANLQEILGASPPPLPSAPPLASAALRRDVHTLTHAADAVDVELSAEEMRYLEEAYKPTGTVKSHFFAGVYCAPPSICSHMVRSSYAPAVNSLPKGIPVT